MGRGNSFFETFLLLAFLPTCVTGCGTNWSLDAGNNLASGTQAATEEPSPSPLSGYYEVASLFYDRHGWVDPSALLVAWVDDSTMPRSGAYHGSGERVFILFDESGTPVLMLGYRAAENTIYFENPEQNFFFGLIPERVDDGWLYLADGERPTHPFTMQFATELLAHDPVGEQRRAMAIRFEMTLLLNEDVPAVRESVRTVSGRGNSCSAGGVNIQGVDLRLGFCDRRSSPVSSLRLIGQPIRAVVTARPSAYRTDGFAPLLYPQQLWRKQSLDLTDFCVSTLVNLA
jgi:hypothetical protein